MFDDIGGKLKGIAKIISWLGIIASVIVAIIVSVFGGWGAVIILVGPILSLIGGLCLYGFGELIDNTAAIREKLTEEINVAKIEENKNAIMPEVKLPIESSEDEENGEPWSCKKCGTANPYTRVFCQKCGEYRYR